MRIAQVGEVWEWCRCTRNPNDTYETEWEPVLLLECLGPSTLRNAEVGSYDWKALDLLTGVVENVFHVPAMGWEKVE